MNAGILQPDATASGLSLDVSFELENRSGRQLGEADGFSVGWQLFDPETALFISEGEWTALASSLPTGQRAAIALRIELPEEHGRYHVYVSPRTKAEGWQYEQQLPFLLVEANVQAGAAKVASFGVTTLGTLRRADWGRKLMDSVTGPWRTLWTNRRLIQSLTRRDIAARYRGSLGDLLWTVLHPLLLMLIYTFVFGVVLKAKFAEDPSRIGFVLYFLAGMLGWLPFSEAVQRSPAIVYEHRNFVKKLLFPVEILPVSPTLAALLSEAIALILFLVLLFAARGYVPVTALALPILLIPQLMLTLGVCWLLAAVGVFLRDLGQMIGFLLTLVFFLTPICYPGTQLPEAAVGILSKSPIYVLVQGYRHILLGSQAPGLASLAGLWVGSALVCLLGHMVFTRLRRTFPDVI
jgi:lipopolysaccharide transport system permease protein